MKIALPDLMRAKFLLAIPAVLIMLSIYSLGIKNCLCFDQGYNVCEGEAIAPGTRLNHISHGFSLSKYTCSMFYSMIASAAYVPYIWARTSELPPYDLDALDKKFPYLKNELTIILRLVSLAAALGILLISFYLTQLFCKTSLPPFLVSMMVVLNFNFMQLATLAFYEIPCIFLVMLSALFFIKTILEKTKIFFWFSGFMVIAAFAIALHERMAGYYLLSGPFLIYKFYKANRVNKRSVGRTVLLLFAGLGLGFFAICLAYSVFISGFKPVFEYLFSRVGHVDMDLDRFRGILGFMDKQFRCQRHALWLIITNLGFIIPLFSLCGLWSVWKKRFIPGIALLLFPIGYHILCIGLPGWTMGRYVMGLTIFATVYAGLGIELCAAYAKKIGKMTLFWTVVIFALLTQLFLAVSMYVADNYYNPYRVTEELIRDPANRGKKFIVQGLARPAVFPCKDNTVCEVITGGEKQVNISILDGQGGSAGGDLYKKEVRNPPSWFVLLNSPRGFYSSPIRFCPITIEWRGSKPKS